MPGSVVRKTLHQLRRSMIWWALGLAGLVGLQMGVYPTVRDDTGISELIESYPEGLKELFGFGGAEFDYTSAEGYLSVELFSLIVPLLLIIAAVATGARAIAGEEEQGRLDVLLSFPLSRRRLVVEELVAMAIEILILCLALLAALGVGSRIVGMSISVQNLAAATFTVALLAIGFGAVALLVGVLTGRRGVAIGVTAALAVAAYLVNSLAALVPWLDEAQRFTPFYHYESSDPLGTGFSGAHPAVLLLVIGCAGVAAVVAADRRDLAT